MWQNIFHKELDPKTWSTGWRVVHGILETKYRISRGRLDKMGTDGKCEWCLWMGRDEDETIEHLLIECGVADRVWDRVNIALFRAGYREICKSPDEIVARVNLGKIENYVVAEVVQALWGIRCREYYGEIRRTWQSVIWAFKHRLGVRRGLDFKQGNTEKWDSLDRFMTNLGVT